MTSDFLNAKDPYAVYQAWLADAQVSEPNDAVAASLATVDEDGMPNVRIVLVKTVEHSGFVFYTNLESTKGRELLGQRKAALCFHWKTLRRQVRVRGRVFQVSDAEADAYFNSRPRGSRIGAWASKQSRPLETNDALRGRVEELTQQYGADGPDEKTVPRPSHWSGFCLEPLSFELWHDRPYRLHDRVLFQREEKSASQYGPWQSARLYP